MGYVINTFSSPVSYHGEKVQSTSAVVKKRIESHRRDYGGSMHARSATASMPFSFTYLPSVSETPLASNSYELLNSQQELQSFIGEGHVRLRHKGGFVSGRTAQSP
jgi:hypothetical protein